MDGNSDLSYRKYGSSLKKLKNNEKETILRIINYNERQGCFTGREKSGNMMALAL